MYGITGSLHREMKNQNNTINIFLIIASVVYLAFELAFNARLTSAAGLSSISNIDNLEFWGRLVSMIGAVLLTLRLLLVVKPSHRINVSLLAFFVVGPIVFFGQKAIVEHIVESSSNETRKLSSRIAFMRQSVETGDFPIEGMPTVLHERNVFLASFNLLSLINPTKLDQIDDELNILAKSILSKGDNVDEYWQQYKSAISHLKSEYSKVERAKKNLNTLTNKAKNQANTLWKESLVSNKEVVAQVGKSRNELVSNVLARKKYIYKSLKHYFSKKETSRTIEKYNNLSTQMFGKVIPKKFWCSTFACPGSEQFVNKKISQLVAQRFENESGINLSSNANNIDADKIRNKQILKALNSASIEPPQGWVVPKEKQQFIENITTFITKKYFENFAKETKHKFGKSLNINGGFQEFYYTPTIQNLMKKSLGINTIDKIKLVSTKRNFETHIFSSLVNTASKELAANMQADLNEFSDGNKHELTSKDSIRLVIIIPLAMGISLLFGLLNALGVIKQILNYLLPQFKPISRLIPITLSLFIFGHTLIFDIQRQGDYQQLYTDVMVHSKVKGFSIDWIKSSQQEFFEIGEWLRVNIFNSQSFGLKGN